MPGDWTPTIPTCNMPSRLKTMAVKGHKFGLDLNENDKTALLAFLRSLK
jgi:hypothetical protein